LQQEIFAIYQNSENKIFCDHQRNDDDFKVKIGPKRIFNEEVKEVGYEKKKILNDFDAFVEEMQEFSLDDKQKAAAEREMGFTEVI